MTDFKPYDRLMVLRYGRVPTGGTPALRRGHLCCSFRRRCFWVIARQRREVGPIFL